MMNTIVFVGTKRQARNNGAWSMPSRSCKGPSVTQPTSIEMSTPTLAVGHPLKPVNTVDGIPKTCGTPPTPTCELPAVAGMSRGEVVCGEI